MRTLLVLLGLLLAACSDTKVKNYEVLGNELCKEHRGLNWVDTVATFVGPDKILSKFQIRAVCLDGKIFYEDISE